MSAFQRIAAVSVRLVRDLGPATPYCAVCGLRLRIRKSEAEQRDKFLAGLIPFDLAQILLLKRDGVNLCVSLLRCPECGHPNIVGESWPLPASA